MFFTDKCLSHNVVSSSLCRERDSNHNVCGDRH